MTQSISLSLSRWRYLGLLRGHPPGVFRQIFRCSCHILLIMVLEGQDFFRNFARKIKTMSGFIFFSRSAQGAVPSVGMSPSDTCRATAILFQYVTRRHEIPGTHDSSESTLYILFKFLKLLTLSRITDNGIRITEWNLNCQGKFAEFNQWHISLILDPISVLLKFLKWLDHSINLNIILFNSFFKSFTVCASFLLFCC